MKTIRVLHIAHLNEMGGIQTRLIDLLSLPVKNFGFYVFSPAPIDPFLQKNLRRLKINFAQASSGGNWKKELIRYALKHKIDIAHFHQSWSVKTKLKKAGVKIIIEHDQGSSWYHKTDTQPDLKTVDAVIALSKASRVMLEKRVGYDPSKIHLIYYGINFKQLNPTASAHRPQGKKIITTVCRLVSFKGVDSILKAIPVVLSERKDVEFWIVGDGPIREELVKLAEDLGISKYVKFWFNQTKVVNFYASTDLFVLASVREPFGSVLIEAGYFSIPAIASNVDGIPEIIIPGKTGILLNPTEPFHPLNEDDPRNRIPKRVVDGTTGKLRKLYSLNHIELGTAILSVLNDPKSLRIMGRRARRRVCKSFEIHRYSGEIVRLYRKLLKQKGVI